ncbi:MAG: FAD-dependent monooxygenase [Ignavibacteriae bacterium]|nr:FAD-dependent monooxygenase [Ignavibacteriota bacterium]
METELKNKVALVGAGLAGSLLGVYLARKNFPVEIFERRPDMRINDAAGGRSINLALSVRGIHALEEVGVADKIMRIAISMRGRMIHTADGELIFQRYGKEESEVIYATSRAELNKTLMTAAEKFKNLHITFDTRCVGMDFDTTALKLVREETGEELSVEPRTVIGTDGSASAVRSAIADFANGSYTSDYLEYGYKELTIPPGPNGRHAMERNALHIWPRTTYMLIALPNLDGSFTCTFFYPNKGEESFETLNTEEKVKTFFAEHFPDVAALIPELTREFFCNPTGSMVTVKGAPWRVEGKALLVGDAAHAIVPFFGQGMNCAFEDCTILNKLLDRQMSYGRTTERIDWNELFTDFEKQRKKDTDAIADLAIENFVEMRDFVAQPKFQLKKKVERLLEDNYPGLFVPKYTMVTFRRMPYSVARARSIVQEGIIEQLCQNLTKPEQLDLRKADVLISRQLDYIE